jgi:RNA polymerase sigma-70 factor (ECF subfamily)
MVTPNADAGAHAAGFRDFFENHIEFVWRNLRRLGVPDAEVETRARQVFVMAHRRLDELDGVTNCGARALLFQIVLGVTRDACHEGGRQPMLTAGEGAPGRPAFAPPWIEWTGPCDALTQLDAALSVLDVDLRATLVLREIEDMTVLEIAQVLGVQVQTIDDRLRIARRKLATALPRPSMEEITERPE